MRLTTKGRYAVTAMLDLSIHSTHGPVNLSDISRRQDISLSYLEQLFSKLRKRNLVNSVRGPGGGYRLGRGRWRRREPVQAIRRQRIGAHEADRHVRGRRRCGERIGRHDRAVIGARAGGGRQHRWRHQQHGQRNAVPHRFPVRSRPARVQGAARETP